VTAALWFTGGLHAQTPESDSAPPAATEQTADPQTDNSQTADSQTDNQLPNTRFEANLAFQRLVENESYEAAEVVGERWLDLTVAEFGAQSVQAAEAHVGVAHVQTHAGQFSTAEEHLLVAVEIYRKLDGVYAESLLQPMIRLGDNYYSDSQYLNAVSAYNEARTISRRAFGLLNEGQIEILDRMTRSFTNMNEYIEADEQQREALKIIERNHVEQSNEVLEAIYKYGRWLRDGHRYGEEREQYTRAIRIVREHYGDGDARMVTALRETGNSFRSQGAAVGQGISGLRQALEILQALPDPDPFTFAQVWRDIGDWQVAFSRVGTESEEYRRAWAYLGNVADGDAIRENWFDGIEYVFREPLSQRGLSADPDAALGSVLVKFDIDTSGRTANVEIVEADPPDFKEEAVARHVRLSRFRPHMRDGELVTAQNMALQVTFRYLPDELTDAN
jgi:TonB family protein